MTTALLRDPNIGRALDAVAAGAVGTVQSVELVVGLAYPRYEGGELPPWYRDAGHPLRDVGAAGLAIMHALLGRIEDVEATWSSRGGDPNLPFDDFRAEVRCERGVGRLQLVASKVGHLVIRGTKGERRVELGGKRRFAAILDGIRSRRAIEVDASATAWAEQLARRADQDHRDRLAKFRLAERVPFLVTGASGHLGRATVARLRAQGHAVRVFVRRVPEQVEPGVEYAIGNLGDPAAVDRAVKGAEVVIHCGAAMTGDWAEHRCTTILGTQNVVEACRRHGVKQLVHISSMSVIDWAGSADNGPVTEDAPLEPRPEQRGFYTRAKLAAEQLVSGAVARGLPAVILRPGQIFGGGIPLINGAVARSAAGRWLVLGDGKLELPLVYIDDVVDAIVLAVEKRLVAGEVIHLIDPEHLTQADVLALAGSERSVVRVPRGLVFALGKLSELPLAAIGRQSPIGSYRLKSALARLAYGRGRASELLDWRPRVGVREGIRRIASA